MRYFHALAFARVKAEDRLVPKMSPVATAVSAITDAQHLSYVGLSMFAVIEGGRKAQTDILGTDAEIRADRLLIHPSSPFKADVEVRGRRSAGWNVSSKASGSLAARSCIGYA